MSKIMTLEVLSSIKGAEPSSDINALFDIIKNAASDVKGNSSTMLNNKEAVSLEDLREDKIIESSDIEKNIIKENFPSDKNGYLVVPKVIED